MKLVVISDTHLKTPQGFPGGLLREMEKADLVVHCGDITEEAVYRFLSDRFSLAAVAGNTDCRQIQEELPDRRIIDCEGKRVGVLHGWGSPLRLAQRVRERFDHPDLILFGHSHVPFEGRIEDTLVFNPGTASAFALKLKRTYGRIDLGPYGIRCEILPVPG